jgi:hypothetical protein
MATMGGSRPGEQRGGRKPGTPNKPQLVITHADQQVRGAASQGFQCLGVTQPPQLVTSGYHRGLRPATTPRTWASLFAPTFFLISAMFHSVASR